jgi:hypothetical protein
MITTGNLLFTYLIDENICLNNLNIPISSTQEKKCGIVIIAK